MAHILITCFGSYGDLFPYISLAKTLKRQEHEVTIGTSVIFQDKIEAEGVAFYHLKSNIDQYSTPEAIHGLVTRLFHPVKGGELMVREMMGRIEDTYNDTFNATKYVDVVITNPLAYATPLVCREKKIPWLSTILAPMFFLSTYDPPIMSPAPWLKGLHRVVPSLYTILFKLIKQSTKPWSKPLYDLCDAHNMAQPTGNPMFEGQYSPYGTLAMFPACFAQPQPDWPVNTHITGFPLFSGEEADESTLSQLQQFLDAGEPPLVFALGSSAVHIAGDFFSVSAAIARKLKRRAVLVCGALDDAVKGIAQGDDLFIVNYVAYDKLFPHASVIVHQGGIGTLAQSLCAQKPILVVPFGFDQFDNGERIEKLGLGKNIRRKNYTVSKAAPLIEALANNASYKQRAVEIGQVVKADDGAVNASNVIENILASSS